MSIILRFTLSTVNKYCDFLAYHINELSITQALSIHGSIRCHWFKVIPICLSMSTLAKLVAGYRLSKAEGSGAKEGVNAQMP